jgi:hypothetical protein
VEEHELRCIAYGIVEFIFQTLIVCPRPISRKNILGRVLFHSQVIINLPNHILLPKLAIAL